MAINKSKIDKMISRILEEEINNKTKTIFEEISEGGEWTEIEVGEELHGGQKKLDVAPPKGKITAADFEKLRSKKKETKEFYFHDEDESIEDAEEKSQDEPTYVGSGLEDNKIKADIKNKIFGSFSDEIGWYDETDREHKGDFDFDYDEEEFDEFEPMYQKYGDKTMWFAPGKEGKKFFDMYKDKFGPMKVRVPRSLDEEGQETIEGNKFTEMLKKTPKGGKFKLGGKEYTDNSNLEEGKKCKQCGMTNCKCNHKKKEVDEKWDGEVKVKQTGEYAKKSLSQIDSKIKKLKDKNEKKKEKGEKIPHKDKTEMSQLYFAKRAKKDWPGKGKTAVKENKSSITLSENELIDMIEKIVMEEKKETSFKTKPEGLKKTEKVLQADKKENDDYAKEVVKKMKEYLKDGSEGTFEMNPTDFPQSNYSLKDMKAKTMKYHPSDAVDEYIEAFSAPGQTNLVFDEIKPDDEKIKKYLKGNPMTGNAELDEKGQPLGNVVPSKTGERFMKNYEDNLYGAEQMEVSYKRQPQPVDVNGTEKMRGSLKSIRKSSGQKAQNIMNKLESVEEKGEETLNEEFKKMKNLISYNRKTQ